MSDDDIDILLTRLHRQARECGPYYALPIWEDPDEREQLRIVVREWLSALSQEAQR